MHIQTQRPQVSPFQAIPTTPSTPGRQPGASVADASSSSSSSSSGTSSTSSATITANDFLELLVTELQNQDPTADTDPNEYVDQLVQVNSLQQLIQIDQNTSGSSSSSSSSGSNSVARVSGGNLSPNLVNRPNFSASASQIASALAPGEGEAAGGSVSSAAGHQLPIQGMALQ